MQWLVRVSQATSTNAILSSYHSLFPFLPQFCSLVQESLQRDSSNRSEVVIIIKAVLSAVVQAIVLGAHYSSTTSSKKERSGSSSSVAKIQLIIQILQNPSRSFPLVRFTDLNSWDLWVLVDYTHGKNNGKAAN